MSPSSRRAWIEITPRKRRKARPHVALLAEGVDRNYVLRRLNIDTVASPSSRRAWIEIINNGKLYYVLDVALLAEGVDRNKELEAQGKMTFVALLAEGVDRNYNDGRYFLLRYNVALLAEGVDRNLMGWRGCVGSWASPSSRRAWIEIASQSGQRPCPPRVALLAEGVDRNQHPHIPERNVLVALLAEGVDRNFTTRVRLFRRRGSPSSRRAWIEIMTASAISNGTPSPSSRRAWIEISSNPK